MTQIALHQLDEIRMSEEILDRVQCIAHVFEAIALHASVGDLIELFRDVIDRRFAHVDTSLTERRRSATLPSSELVVPHKVVEMLDGSIASKRVRIGQEHRIGSVTAQARARLAVITMDIA